MNTKTDKKQTYKCKSCAATSETPKKCCGVPMGKK
jgi:hypothetical protein